MIMEKTAREMYAKNREKIMQKARGSNSGFFGVGFYNNFNVLLSARVPRLEFNGIIILSFTSRYPVRGC
ncbi:MAG: hypothetical protein NHB15_02325 [Methanosarcina barkeri]|nr:hypothetical protein [Methanosarcina sp. ERenArc_MAG2]